MKLLLILSASACLFVGCAGSDSSRAITGTLAGAGGAALGHELSDGDGGWTAAGAGAGVIASEAVHHVTRKKAQASYEEGYDKGRSDAVKQQYWLMIDAQNQGERDSSFTFYDLPIPAYQDSGATLLPSMQTLRIQE